LAIQPTLARLKLLLPTGQTLPYAAWRRRHHAMVGLLLFEAVGLALFSLGEGNSWVHSWGHAAALIPIALIGLKIEHRRRAASVLISLGLITACALLVHIWHGAIEAHFLFFITIMVLALYEDWTAFLIAFAYVVVHHGLMGALDPSGVYDHQDAIDHPWKWALIHGGFVLAAGIVAVIAWRLNEGVREEATRSEERFRGAFEGAPIGMILFTFGGPETVAKVNEAMCEITGHTREELEAGRIRALVHPDDEEATHEAVEKMASGEQTRSQAEIRYIHADGHTVWVSVSLSMLRPGHGLAQVQDITERKLATEELADLVLQDPLTGLGNRRALLADLQARLDQVTPEAPMMLQLFDLDGFKTYNDTYGHPAGDSLLTRMAQRLRDGLEGRATAYRMGGDEFCVLSLLECDDHERIALTASHALSEHGEGFNVTASHGSVKLPTEAATATEALREADRRMYARKSLDSRSSAGRQSADVLLSILSERNEELGVHLDEVTALAEAVADRLDLSDEELAPLLQAASLHDVGKAAIPDEILNKAGPLDDAEWAFMKRHTVIGERILASAPALTRASKLVRWSHEHFDGTGYPDQLAGEDIPLGSRIIAVCDAYDAMVSDRPYRAPLTSVQALAELRRCAGTQFDAQVVTVFGEILAERERRLSGLPERELA
jgi:diguanylate cyclase (GGDEF)-like protein/PAS domain S-box-containing protein